MLSDKAIEINGLVKYYGKLQALKGISLEVKRGDFFAFLGPNGAGKTTMISALTGLCNYQAGSIRIFDYDVRTDYRTTRKLTGLCAQDFNFDPFLSIYRLLIYQAGYFGIPKNQAARRADELLVYFGLGDKRREEYRTLSGGMKRRLLLCRALIHDPELLILDEPTAGADLELKYMIWKYLEEINAQGKTILLTTHYMEEAERLCRTIAIIHKGEVVRHGEKKEVLRDKSLEHVFLQATGEP